MNTLHPAPEHRFSFGLWSVRHQGRDPVGEVSAAADRAVRVRPPARRGRRLGCQLRRRRPRAAWDRMRSNVTTAVERLRNALDSTGMVVSMATTNLYAHPVFREGAFRQAIGTSGASPFRRRCGRSTSAPSSARRRTPSGADGATARPSPPSRWPTRSPAIARRSTSCAGTSAIGATRPASPQLEPTTGRHAAADGRSCLGVHRDARPARHGRSQPGRRPRAGAGPPRRGVLPRRRPGDRRRQAVPHRASTPTIGRSTRTCASGRRPQGRLLPRQAARGLRLRRRPPLRHRSVPRRGHRGRLRLRRGVHAHLPRPRRQGAALRRRSAHPGRPRRVRRHGARRRDVGRFTPEAADVLAAELFDPDVLAKQGHRNDHLDQLVVELIMGLR